MAQAQPARHPYPSRHTKLGEPPGTAPRVRFHANGQHDVLRALRAGDGYCGPSRGIRRHAMPLEGVGVVGQQQLDPPAEASVHVARTHGEPSTRSAPGA